MSLRMGSSRNVELLADSRTKLSEIDIPWHRQRSARQARAPADGYVLPRDGRCVIRKQ
jgi:hypothetical protein